MVNSAWRVFCPCLFKALGRASVKTGILGTPRFFHADGVGLGKRCEEKFEKAVENESCKKVWSVIGCVHGGILHAGGNGNGGWHNVELYR